MIEYLQTGVRLSGAVVHGGTVHLSGQVPGEPAGDIQSQTRRVLGRIDQLLAEAGTDKSRLLTATIYLRDMAEITGMNEVWEDWIKPEQAPARTTVEARLANPAYRVEITVTAALPERAASGWR